MRFYLSVLSCLLLTIFSGVSAFAQQSLGRAAFCNVETFAGSNPQGASATIWRGRPIILIDRSQFANRL